MVLAFSLSQKSHQHISHGKELRQGPSNVNDKIQGNPKELSWVLHELASGLAKAYPDQLRNLSADSLGK